MKSSRYSLLMVALLSLSPGAAHALDVGEDPAIDVAVEEPERPAYAADALPPLTLAPEVSDADPHVRFELTMGFVFGYGRYSEMGLTGSPALPRDAFDAGPAAGAAMAGLRYDARLVISFVRMTIGGDAMWGLFEGGVARDVGGMPLVDRRLFDGALRFGLGLEANIDGVRLFADVLGTVHFTEVAVEQNDAMITHRAVAFSPGLRLGVRIPVVPHFFVQLSADGSPFGPSWVGGDLSVGGAIE